jgi:D-serine deaminase-like pyridoxal phosphate-dependent protein
MAVDHPPWPSDNGKCAKGMTMVISELETPKLLLDRTIMMANIDRMARHLSKLGVPLRPHVKTSKSAPIANALTKGQPGGITVSTLAEADLFAAEGYRDILYAVGIAPNKLAHIARLRREGVSLKIILDSLEAARATLDYAQREGVTFDVLLEIDCDGHRSGLTADDPLIVELARLISEGPGTNLLGLMTHAGGSYDCRDTACIVAAAEQERSTLVEVAERLRSLGFPCPVVSVGSSPTASFAVNLDGVSEVRAGVFVFNDMLMANLGVCTTDQIALSVLTTVIAHRPERNWLITDSGWMALSADQSTKGQKRDYGFGLVCDVNGTPVDDLTVVGVNQEHGIIGRSDGSTFDLAKYPVGTMLRILPIHACATAAFHAEYFVLDEAGNIIESWPRIK